MGPVSRARESDRRAELDVDIEMRRVKGTLRGLDPTLLRVKGHRDLTDPTLTLAGSDPGTLQGRAIRVSGSRAGSRVP
jgi:hypothetical protein